MGDVIWHHAVHRSGDTCTVLLSGELDLSSVNELTCLFLTEAERHDTRAIRADLTAVQFIDSSAIGVLINGYKTAQACGTSFTVTGTHGQVRKVLDMAGVSELLDGHPPT